MIQSIKKFLKLRLKKKLPGMRAQEKMSPISVSEDIYKKYIKKDVNIGSVLIIFYSINEQLYFPLIERTKNVKYHSKQISFPGGKFEESDNNLSYTAIRETKEEIGLLPSNLVLLGSLTKLYIPASNFEITPFIAIHEIKPDFKLNKEEVDNLIEVPLKSIFDKRNISKKKMKLSIGKTLDCPFFNLNGYVVWGATAMILSELSIILKKKYDHE